MTAKKTTTAKKKPEQDHHFFVTSASDWQTADTKEEAIRLLLKRVGKEGLKLHLEHYGHMSINCYKVLAPSSAKYMISDRRPHDVATDPVEQLKVIDEDHTIVPLTRA